MKSNMDFNQEISKFKEIFEPKLHRYLDDKISQIEKFYPEAQYTLEEIKRITLSGGKRIRPALVYFGYKIGNDHLSETVYEIGIALEILHTFLLIHDDIMDEATERRGVPTISPSTQAILAGDFANMLANEIMNKQSVNKDVIDLFYTLQYEVITGQIDDCLYIGKEELASVNEERIVRMLNFKSGRYSIEKPLLIGATLAKLNSAKLRYLSRIGENLGLVFQITDDILGIFGEENKTGKSADSDIKEGKRTLLVYKTYRQSNSAEKIKIQSVLGNKNADLKDIQWFKKIIRQKGTVNELNKYCQKLVEESHILLKKHFDLRNAGVNFIYNLGSYLLDRQS